MRDIRIFVACELAPGQPLELPVDAARHVTRVLRLTAGAPVVLFNGDGYDYQARLLESARDRAHAVIESRGPLEPLTPLRIHLGLGLSKGERMDFAIQKAVELGVAEITPLFTARTQLRLSGARLQRRAAHWHGVIVAACEQSGRRRLPTLAASSALGPWLAARSQPGLLLDPTAGQALADLERPAGMPASVVLLVGPEGGLDPSECAQAHRCGWQGVRLGPRILRTETAPLAAIAILQALWGDMG